METIRVIQAVGAEWASRYPEGPRLQIGDISKQGGGELPPHKSHDRGLDFDIQIIRTDSQELWRSVTVNDTTGAYDRGRTQELINIIREIGNVDRIFSADPKLVGTRGEPTHIYHLHIRLQGD